VPPEYTYTSASFTTKPLLCHACHLLKDGASYIIDRASMTMRLYLSVNDAKWTLRVERELPIGGHRG